MCKTALVTGVTGQDGSYLSELLLDKNYKVYGMIRRSSVDTTERIAHLIPNPNFEPIEGDITDASCMNRLISGIQPNEVYNLAAMSHVGVSFDQPMTTCQIDAIGPLNILEAIRQCSPKSKFYQASTSELFGDTNVSPQNEDTPFNPNSPYAVAKLYAHHLVGLYRRAYGIFACAGILFNHESPRRGGDFVTRKITKYVAQLAKVFEEAEYHGDSDIIKDFPKLLLGNLDAKRDWSFAGDVVCGMWMMLQQNKPDDYVLGSDETHSIRELLKVAFGAIGVEDYDRYVTIHPKFCRPVDVNLLCADSTKAKRILGWESTTGFDKLIRDMVEADLRVVGADIGVLGSS